MCIRPYKQGVLEYGCGQCSSCRLNRRRQWTARLLLEWCCHTESMWPTLTYDNKHLPVNGSLVPRDIQLFLKSLRKSIHPSKVRFYVVGEYGDRTQRPHYHCVLFGLDNQVAVKKAWPHGSVFFGVVSPQSLAYNVSHITKSTHKFSDYKGMLKGRYPEFHRMSLRPGIGYNAVEGIADWLTSHAGAKYVSEHHDVVSSFRMEGVIWPLGRYLKNAIREKIGMSTGQSEQARYIQAMERLDLILVKGNDFIEAKRKQDSFNADGHTKRVKLRRSL